MMRDRMSGGWEGFHPETNIFWLHYLLKKLTNEIVYKSTKSQVHRGTLARLRHWENTILSFSSAKDFIMENENLVTD